MKEGIHFQQGEGMVQCPAKWRYEEWKPHRMVCEDKLQRRDRNIWWGSDVNSAVSLSLPGLGLSVFFTFVLLIRRVSLTKKSLPDFTFGKVYCERKDAFYLLLSITSFLPFLMSSERTKGGSLGNACRERRGCRGSVLVLSATQESGEDRGRE